MNDEQALRSIEIAVDGRGVDINTQLIETNRLLGLLVQTQTIKGTAHLMRLLSERKISHELYFELIESYKAIMKAVEHE